MHFFFFKCRRNSKQGDLTCSGVHCCFPSLTILGNDTDKQNSLESGFNLLAHVPRTVASLMNFAPSSVWSFHHWFDKKWKVLMTWCFSAFHLRCHCYIIKLHKQRARFLVIVKMLCARVSMSLHRNCIEDCCHIPLILFLFSTGWFTRVVFEQSELLHLTLPLNGNKRPETIQLMSEQRNTSHIVPIASHRIETLFLLLHSWEIILALKSPTPGWNVVAERLCLAVRNHGFP